MAYLAMRGSGVDQWRQSPARRGQSAHLSAAVPALAAAEVPVGYVTNGVHTPSWDSAAADELWTAALRQAALDGRARVGRAAHLSAID